MNAHRIAPIEILLVEDNEGDIFLTKDALSKTNIAHNVHVAINGEVGLNMLKQVGEYSETPLPDIILLDINLPLVSGIELLDIIKNDDKLKQIPVIMLTSSTYKKDVTDCYSKHANSYIVKPQQLEDYRNIATAFEQFWLDVSVLPRAVD